MVKIGCVEKLVIREKRKEPSGFSWLVRQLNYLYGFHCYKGLKNTLTLGKYVGVKFQKTSFAVRSSNLWPMEVSRIDILYVADRHC